MKCLCPACEHSTAPPGSRLQAGPLSWSRITPRLVTTTTTGHHCAPCNVTTTRPQQTAAPAVVCLLRVFLLTGDLLFWASVVMGAGGAMQIIQKYAIIILRRSTAAQASSNVSQENTNHLNGIYYLYRDSKTFLQILHNFHYCMKCQFLGEKIQN